MAAVVAPEEAGGAAEGRRLDLAAERAGVPLVSDDDLYAAIDDPAGAKVDLIDVDAVFSLLFWKRIREPLIELGGVGCLNFHPAPLPDMRGHDGATLELDGRKVTLLDRGLLAEVAEAYRDAGVQP